MIPRNVIFAFFLTLLPLSLQASALQTDSSSVEWIKVYFNMPADHSVALPGNMSNSSQDLIGSLQSLIDSASYSVDLAIYDLENPRIAHALVKAKKRGVRVRIVTDNYNRTDGGAVDSVMWATLRSAGIISIDDDGDIYEADGSIADHSLTNSGADMHHKFAVIDGRDHSLQNDIVWTGSTNLTLTGAYNTNNVVVIKDDAVARAYTTEFEQMWGDSDDTPNARSARFHKDKKEAGKHIFYVDSTRLELYFAPINRSGTKPSIMKRLVEVIHAEAQHDVVFQAFAITPGIPMSRAIWRMSATGDIILQGLIDPLFYYRYRNNGEIWASREAKVSNRLILPANEMRKLHDKVMLLDSFNPDLSDQGVTIGGSFNFSNNAEVNNDENLLIIYSDRITNQFYQDFRGALLRAEHKASPPAPPLFADRWYRVQRVRDGSEFKIEVMPGFEYGVEFLGVDVPRIYAGNDSSEYYSVPAADSLRKLLLGGKVKLEGPSGGVPRAKYGAYHAYVTLRKQGKRIALNMYLLDHGLGSYSKYYAQHPDSVRAFKKYESATKAERAGIWKSPHHIGQKISRAEAISKKAEPSQSFPININTADENMLKLLPGIGPAYARRIIEYRKERGGFNNIDQLRDINGIGPKTMQKLRPNVVLD